MDGVLLLSASDESPCYRAAFTLQGEWRETEIYPAGTRFEKTFAPAEGSWIEFPVVLMEVRIMILKRFTSLLFVLSLSAFFAPAQAAQEPQTLESGKALEREITGGQSHAYQLKLAAGQFLRVVVEQKRTDVVLALTGPDGKKLVESDLTAILGARDSLSFEATTTGDYLLVVRANGVAALRGAYQIRVELKAAATAQDRQRLNAEQLLYEARLLINERKYTDPQWSEKLGRSLALWRELNDRYGQVLTLNLTGLGLAGANQYDKAIESYEQALALWRTEKLPRGEALVLRNMGDTYTNLARLDKAVECYELALPIYRELKDRMNEALTLGPLANAYSWLGRHDLAIAYFEQALPINREFKNHFRIANNLNGLGNAYQALEQFEKAAELYEQGLAISRENKLRSLEGTILCNIAMVCNLLKRYDKAIESAQQALVIARESKEKKAEAIVFITLGNTYYGKAQYPQAIEYHDQALRLTRAMKTRTREAEALHGLMETWEAQNRPSLAIFFGKQVVNLYQEIRSEISGLERETQQSFVKSNEDAYRTLADLLIAQGRLPEAEQVIRMLKDEEYFEYIRRDQGNSPKTAKAQLTPEEQAIEKRYREISEQIAELGTERGTLIDKKTRTPEEEQRLVKLDADLVVAGTAFQKFLSTLESEMSATSGASGKVYAMRESQGLMEDLRELGKGTVALYTLVGEDKYRVILTTADFQKGYEFPVKAAELNRKLLEFREVLQNPKYDPLPLAQELYKILLGPLAKDLEKAKAHTLMWSLDGVLRYLPVAALHDGKQYLVEQYRNAVFTPASQARLKDMPGRSWKALGLGVTKSFGERIPALPGVSEEMHGIIREADQNDTRSAKRGVLPGIIRLDEQFTQEAMLAGLRQRPPVVHVASHFQFQPGNETNSALLLGDGSFLSLAQIKSLPNVFGGVELLTLSACNTATGGAGANGREVEGFGVLAQRQGAKAVIASLWPVFDTSTKVLMQDFYRIREARQDTSKAEALRQAQLRLLRGEAIIEATNPPGPTADRKIIHEEAKPGAATRVLFKADARKPYAHPYFWAPFILIGNWR
jgi:CHAT domain-containing protein/tetratricopeptide (TPR) repeat protein